MRFFTSIFFAHYFTSGTLICGRNSFLHINLNSRQKLILGDFSDSPGVPVCYSAESDSPGVCYNWGVDSPVVCYTWGVWESRGTPLNAHSFS